MSKKPVAWRVGEVGIPDIDPKPFGEALVDWPRFSKYLRKYRSKAHP